MSADHVIAPLASLWLGMVLAISFLEAPLKFRAKGLTIPVGLEIGRLVFRALNAVEVVLAVALVSLVFAADAAKVTVAAALVAGICLLAQLFAVRPALTKRTDAIREGGSYEKRSNVHLWYVGLEGLKVLALIAVVVTALMAA